MVQKGSNVILMMADDSQCVGLVEISKAFEMQNKLVDGTAPFGGIYYYNFVTDHCSHEISCHLSCTNARCNSLTTLGYEIVVLLYFF